MRTFSPPICVVLLASTLSVSAQGPLTPPGAPAPTMKTLELAQPRRPISSVPFVIDQPGSYYLTGNLVLGTSAPGAIDITASNVTLDFMGFTLSSAAAISGNAVRVVGDQRNLVIQNGTISGNTTVEVVNGGWVVSPAGFTNGISVTGQKPSSSRFTQLQITGCRSIGLDAGVGAIVSDVIAASNGQTGINAPTCVISNSVAELNGGSGFFVVSGSVTNSRSTSNGGDGFIGNGMVLTNSVARSNGGNGINATNGVIAFCKAAANAAEDIIAPGAARTGNSPTP